jgi:hypothetical protein
VVARCIKHFSAIDHSGAIQLQRRDRRASGLSGLTLAQAPINSTPTLRYATYLGTDLTS